MSLLTLLQAASDLTAIGKMGAGIGAGIAAIMPDLLVTSERALSNL